MSRGSQRVGDDRSERGRQNRSHHGRGDVLKRLLAVLSVGVLLGACMQAAQVEQGMPAGAAIFDQTDPACLPNPDGTSFRCTLSRPPAADQGTYAGAKEVLAIDGVAAGGRIGLDAAGMTWDCLLGQSAVDRAIISQDFLGQPVSGPGQG
jgi:hypothetical protein